jgi:uncharacterized membrane protein YagU involved in acid resistance
LNASSRFVAKDCMKVGRYRIEREDASILKGLVAGMVAGLVATYAKDKFQTLMTQVAEAEAKPKPRPRTAAASAAAPKSNGKPKEDPSTVKVANAIAKRVVHRNLTKKEKELAGPMVDYGFGTLAATAYGAMAEVAPQVSVAGGAGFGAALWFVGDELGVPAAGLSKWPTQYPASTHAYALSGHLVYGAVTELVRRIVRKALD